MQRDNERCDGWTKTIHTFFGKKKKRFEGEKFKFFFIVVVIWEQKTNRSDFKNQRWFFFHFGIVVIAASAATNDIDDEKSIENNCQLHSGCGNNHFFLITMIVWIKPLVCTAMSCTAISRIVSIETNKKKIAWHCNALANRIVCVCVF